MVVTPASFKANIVSTHFTGPKLCLYNSSFNSSTFGHNLINYIICCVDLTSSDTRFAVDTHCQAGVTYWKNQAGAEVALININDAEEEGGKRQIVLVKPQSYMNTSGGPISKLCREYKIKAEELLVIHDELDIPAGDVRVKVGGGHAGHNGLRSIIDKMGSRDFSRIRTGIGNPPGKMAVADYVLKQLRAREAEDFQDTCARAADAAGLAIVRGVVYARDHVNGAASANGKH